MKTVRVLGFSLCLGVAGLFGGAAVGFAQDAQQGAQDAQAAAPEEPSLTIDQVLEQARRVRTQVSEENQRREAEFRRERARQQSLLNQANADVQAAERRSTQLENTFNTNEAEIARLDEQLRERQGEFAELFGAARQAAAETRQVIELSLISGQLRGRIPPLEAIAQSRTLPTIEQLEQLYLIMLEEMVEQAKVATFTSDVINVRSGTPEPKAVTRIGPFVAFADGKYLVYEPQTDTLEFLARQPQTGGALAAARRVANYTGDGFVQGVIDPSMGQLLGLLIATPDLRERIDQGGPIGYGILVILAIGTLVGIYKWLTLIGTAGAVSGQIRRGKPSKSNPLGRIMLAYEANQGADVETMSLKLDEAVLKEIPRLESLLNMVKVFAAIAPLLGLLGTVTGMIKTFQQITLFGTGDPKIMAGGISEALVTTMLGLISAIPLLLLHSFASTTSRRVAQVLEEQAAGLIAQHAERT